MAFELDITHRSRHVPFGGDTGDGDIIMMGEDLSAASFAMTFAASQGAAALITLSNAAAGSQGVSAAYDASYIHPDRSVVGATTVRPLVTEATFEALTWGPAPSAPVVLQYDLLVTPVGGTQRVICFGSFTIYPGIGD